MVLVLVVVPSFFFLCYISVSQYISIFPLDHIGYGSI